MIGFRTARNSSNAGSSLTPLPGNAPEKKNRPIIKIGLLAVILVTGGALLYLYLGHKLSPNGAFQEIRPLVADKISRSAAILITLPEGVSIPVANAQEKISFDPAIAGTWRAGNQTRELIYVPNNKLEKGKFYHVTAALATGEIAKDFEADDDPKVDAIFPAADSEANEVSSITIVFNRPMVPLTTLDAQMSVPLPVSIEPSTDGKFKWITTRNLQFIPTTRLHRSSHYHVKVDSGLTSLDGLSVPSADFSFVTRPLRYEGDQIHHDGLTLNNEPAEIHFNQPVDLVKTRPQIEVLGPDNHPVNTLIEYGTRNNLLDKSFLRVYSSQDKFGRRKFWNNNTTYQLTIKGAVPLEGDISLSDTRTATIQVPDILAGVSADSPRSQLVDADLFDPQGKAHLTFYEDIDKNRSLITAPGLEKIDYAEKCKTDEFGDEIYIGDQCQKEPDKKQLTLSFRSDHWNNGDKIDIQLKAVVNTDGLKLNGDPQTRTLTVYSPLQILKTVPSDGAAGVPLTDLTICTTTPLQDADEKTFSQYLQSNITVGKWRWDQPFKVVPSQQGVNCQVGQFENRIHFGLQPETDYQLTLNLVDDFGQTASTHLHFTSGKIQNMYRHLNTLQKLYNVTTPDHTKLTYTAENVEYADVHLCELSGAGWLKYQALGLPDETTRGEELNCQRQFTKRINLPKQYWTVNYFQIDIKDLLSNPLGFYAVSVSNPDVRKETSNNATGKTEFGKQLIVRNWINVTNLTAQEKRVEADPANKDAAERTVERKQHVASGGNLYWVLERGSLAPVAGAQVSTFRIDNGTVIADSAGTTNDQGIARLAPYYGNGYVLVTSGRDATMVAADKDKFQWAGNQPGGDTTYIYSDRPIYRPGQDVFIKGLYRLGFDAVYEIFRDKKADIHVFNSKEENFFTTSADVNEYGTFNTTIHLPSDAPLGTYRVEALSGTYYFSVEDYVPAAFKLDLSTDKPEYIAGDTFDLKADANYYFGVPVENGKLEYTIVTQDYYFDRYTDQYFSFDSGWYDNQDGGYGDTFVKRGKVDVNSQGKAEIRDVLDFDKFFQGDARQHSKVFVVRVTVTNGTGQQVSQEKSFIVHRGQVYLGVNLDHAFFQKNDHNTLRVKSVDTQGKSVAASNISVKVNKVHWDYFKRREVDGSYYYHSDKKLETIRQFTVSTDNQGNWQQDFTIDKEGEYEITVDSKDGRGNPVTSTMSVYVTGSGAVDIEPLNNESLDLAVAKNKFEPGETAHIIIKSPFPKAKALISIERGTIFDYAVVDVTSNLYDYSFPIKANYAPNMYATVLLLSPTPEVKFGQVGFNVGTQEKTLEITATPNKKSYLPGEKVELDIEAKDANHHPVQAEVSVAVADLSVLALVGNPKKDPVAFFYGGQPLGVITSSNVKNILTEAEIPAGTKGGGGSEPDDLAKKKRGVFKDTAYWNATVTTDSNGHAHVSFTLPDNLTTWQVENIGLTADTRLGVSYDEFVAKKDLMVIPLKPRFVVPGDEFMVGAKIFNQTGQSQTVKVAFQSDTLEKLGGSERSLTVAANDTTVVYFPVRAPANRETGEHVFTVSAKNSQYEDTAENSITITPNNTYETVATANSTSGNSADEYLYLPSEVIHDKGEVTISSSATLAVFLSNALQYLVSYPYGCTEQMDSELSAIATVKRGLNLPNVGDKLSLKPVTFDGKTYTADDVVNIGLARIMSNRTPEGAFTYYPGLKPDFYLTLNTLNTLIDLKEAGYNVDDSVINGAVHYLSNAIWTDANVNANRDAIISTAYTFSRIPTAANDFAPLKSRVLVYVSDKKYFQEDISVLTLTQLALLSHAAIPQIEEQVYKNLENRVDVDGRGAYLKSTYSDWVWQYYETPIKDTALFLKAIAVAHRDYPLTDKVLRWLLNSRDKDGAWGSTNNTLAVVDAFTDYLQWKRETESNFKLDVVLDQQKKDSFTFTADTIFKTYHTVISVASLPLNTLMKLSFVKTALNSLPNTFYYDAALRYFLPIKALGPRDEGFTIERAFYSTDDAKGTTPLMKAKVGQVLRGRLTITTAKPRNYVAAESFIPAGTELVNLNLATESQNVIAGSGEKPSSPVALNQPTVTRPPWWSRWWYQLTNFAHWFQGTTSAVGELPDDAYSNVTIPYLNLSPDAQELHDDRIMLFQQTLQPGVYTYDYYVRALIPGTYQYLPASVSELYTPENFGRTRGEQFVVAQ